MDKPQYQQIVIARPACRAWAADGDAKKAAIGNAVDVAIDRICTASSEFDFLHEVHEITTEADTVEYAVEGDSKNCRDVISVRFGDERRLLEKLTKNEADAHVSSAYTSAYGTTGTATNVQVGWWWIERVENQFPVIKLLGTPEADAILYCRITVRGILAQRVPNEWRGVVIALAEDELFGMGGIITQAGGTQSAHPQLFSRKAENKLSDMVDRYRRRGPGDQPYPVDQITKKQNRRRNAMHGY